MCETTAVKTLERSSNGEQRMVSPTTTTTNLYAPNVRVSSSEATKEEKSRSAFAAGSIRSNCAIHSTANTRSPITEAPSTCRSSLFRLMRFVLWNGPMLACWFILLASGILKEVWHGPLEKLLQSFKLEEGSSDLGTYDALDHELTYYHRRCDHRDISTRDANDLLINPNMTHKERQEVVMTHGAAVMKNMISHSTARELREYLETKHHEFYANDLALPWDELFWDGGGERLSLGLGPEDASIVRRAIAEVGANPELKKTLESILGDDPAVVEVSTLNTMHDASAQGIHTDSDFFASSVLYTRSFLHSYTMFISLQDTTSRMGATTICPGTHWCADEELENLCQCEFLDDDPDEEYPIGYCNTFEASSNGKTGLEVGVLQRGDAMMFNQNIWHRGPKNNDEMRKEARAMFIMTFVSRRHYEKGDNRQQGWGTYYYMRHSMWGHLFSDLKTAASGGMDLFKRRIWKAYGLVGASKKGNLPWLEHWARQMSNGMDFFSDGELEDFQIMLKELTANNRLAKWFFLDDAVMKYLFGKEDYDDDDIGWKEYLDLLVESVHYQSKQLYFVVATATVLVNVVCYALYCVFWWIFNRRKQGNDSFTPLLGQPQPIRDVSRSLGTILSGHLLVLGMAIAIRHFVLYRAPLYERINTGDINFKPFPPLPYDVVIEPAYNDDGEEIGTQTFHEEIYPVDLIFDAQDREIRDFRMKHPEHPYNEYYDKENERLEASRRSSGYLIPKTNLPDPQQLPIKWTAYPERNDVLIGSRFDADFLASMNFVLDFHPGTKEWINHMKEHQHDISRSADKYYLDMVVDTIVSKILNENEGSSLSLLLNEGGTPRRFLKQDYETGWWTIMTRSEAIAITRRALLALSHPKSISIPYEHWKQLLAESRFGKRRHTALAKTWTSQRVEKRLEQLFWEEKIRKEHRSIVSPLPSANTMKEISTKEQRSILLPSTGRGLLPKSIITGKSASSVFSAPISPSTVLSERVFMRELQKNVVTLKVGDHVLYKGHEDEELFFQATIVEIDAEEEELMIQPLRSDDVSSNFEDITMLVHIGDIQFYRPTREGDEVWALTDDPDGEDESWKIYEVSYLTPFGQAEIKMTSKYAQRFSDDEEDFDNKPFQRDVKDFLLTERSVPEIRLRQY